MKRAIQIKICVRQNSISFDTFQVFHLRFSAFSINAFVFATFFLPTNVQIVKYRK